MRSSIISSVASLDGYEDDAKVTSVHWWRSLPEFQELVLAKGIAHTPRLKVVKELERLALVANESLDDLRHRLLTYKAGDLWFPAGGITKQEADIPPVITILLLGFASTGKSSLVTLMYSVLGRSGIVPFGQTTSPAGKDGRTLCLEEHNVLRSVRNGFCVFDSRGLDYDGVVNGLDEVAEWMEEGVRHRQLCRGAANGPDARALAAAASNNWFSPRRVNAVMVVVNLSEMYTSLVAGDRRPLEATRDLFHAPSINLNCNDKPILVLTHGDELEPEERVDARVQLCEYLGVPEATGVYDVMCLNEHGVLVDDVDPVTAYALSEAVYSALLVGDRCHPPKRSARDWLALGLSWALWFLSALFTFLAQWCSKLAKQDRNKLRLQ